MIFESSKDSSNHFSISPQNRRLGSEFEARSHRIMSDYVTLKRCESLYLDAIERGGQGNCFFRCIAAATGIHYMIIRRGVMELMLEREDVYGGLGDFSAYGGYEAYCYLVGSDGFYVQDNSKIIACVDWLRMQGARHEILILGASGQYDVFVSGDPRLSIAPIGNAKGPIILIHLKAGAHYMEGVRQTGWSIQKGRSSNGVRVADLLSLQQSMATELNRIIQQARSAVFDDQRPPPVCPAEVDPDVFDALR